jgi:hypothetical protein
VQLREISANQLLLQDAADANSASCLNSPASVYALENTLEGQHWFAKLVSPMPRTSKGTETTTPASPTAPGDILRVDTPHKIYDPLVCGVPKLIPTTSVVYRTAAVVTVACCAQARVEQAHR